MKGKYEMKIFLNLSIIGLLLSTLGFADEPIFNGPTTTYLLNEKHQFESGISRGYNFNEFYGPGFDKFDYCGSNNGCIERPIEEGRCILTNADAIVTPGPAHVEARIMYSTTLVEYGSSNYFEDKPMFSVEMDYKEGNRFKSFEPYDLMVSDFPFSNVYREDDGRFKRLTATTGTRLLNLLDGYHFEKPISNFRIKICNVNATSLRISSFKIVTKVDD